MVACTPCPDYPRLVKHVDDAFLRKVTELYRQRLPGGGTSAHALHLQLHVMQHQCDAAGRGLQLWHDCRAGGTVLDLMSSWVSHLPEGKRFAKVVGHGMNAAEAGAFGCLASS